jgi:hypothetical protein
MAEKRRNGGKEDEEIKQRMHYKNLELLHCKMTNNSISCFFLIQLLADSYIFDDRSFLF